MKKWEICPGVFPTNLPAESANAYRESISETEKSAGLLLSLTKTGYIDSYSEQPEIKNNRNTPRMNTQEKCGNTIPRTASSIGLTGKCCTRTRQRPEIESECELCGYKKRDIFYADLRPVVGSEQGGIRPVLIIQNDVGNKHSPTVICAAITSKMNKAKLPTHIEIDASAYGIEKDSVILLEQLRTIDKKKIEG